MSNIEYSVITSDVIKSFDSTSICRTAQYMVLFRCPADRRQTGIVADRVFDKNKPAFMEIHYNITSKPYSYV